MMMEEIGSLRDQVIFSLQFKVIRNCIYNIICTVVSNYFIDN